MKERIELRKKQLEIVEKIVKNIDSNHLYEAPTAFGKTAVILSAASRLIRLGKKVVISTSSNNLALEMIRYTRLYDLNIEDSQISLSIGKSNYIDPKKLAHAEALEDMFNISNKESYTKWRTDTREDELLFDDFFENITLSGNEERSEIIDLLKYKDSHQTGRSFNESEIIVTNHFYLIHRVAKMKNLDLDDHVILFDEVHEIINAAEKIFQASFSPHHLESKLNQIIKKESMFSNEKNKALKKCAKKMNFFVNNTAKEGGSMNIGEYIFNGTLHKKIISDLPDLHREVKKIESIIEKNKESELCAHAKKEIMELNSVMLSIANPEKNISIYFSESRGYPSIKSTITRLETKLFFDFWEKIGSFAGLSATLLVEKQSNASAEKYAYSRIGVKFDECTSKVIFIERDLPKENVQIFMPKSSMPSPVPSKSDEYEEWIDFTAKHIAKCFKGKNTMVLAGGYEDARRLSEMLTGLVDVEVHTASPGKNMRQTVEEFKSKGGILVGTRNYGVGVSLEGEMLECIFLLRFPYPVFTSKRWLDLRYRNDSKQFFWHIYTNEMLLSLRQNLGRLQRGFKDKGEIHILDSRIYDKSSGLKKFKVEAVAKKIQKIVMQYGICKEEVAKKIEPQKKEPTDIKDLMKEFGL